MVKCKVNGCESIKLRARGLCSPHWNKEQYGDCINGCKSPASNSKGLCTNCYKRGGKSPEKRRDGLCNKCGEKLDSNSRCLVCRKKQKRAENIFRKYKISIDEWDKILEKQNMVCKICKGDALRFFVVDHDHSCCKGSSTCGKCIRGILCENCNRALGLVKDSVEILEEMVRYLNAS